jgi:CheY-like chemotaxis protein
MPKIILIVEDYEDTRNCMKLLVEAFGYLVNEASNGVEAVDAVKLCFPDLILMDISMPVMDGLTATKVIRKFKGTDTIPIIAVSAFGNRFYKQALEAGCDDLIDKPVDFDNLEPFLKRYLS